MSEPSFADGCDAVDCKSGRDVFKNESVRQCVEKSQGKDCAGNTEKIESYEETGKIGIRKKPGMGIAK